MTAVDQAIRELDARLRGLDEVRKALLAEDADRLDLAIRRVQEWTLPAVVLRARSELRQVTDRLEASAPPASGPWAPSFDDFGPVQR